jgi:hypothetical protein
MEVCVKILSLVLCLLPCAALASPAVRLIEPPDQAKITEIKADVVVVARSTQVKEQIQTTVIDLKVVRATGTKAAALPKGSWLRFEHRCSTSTEPLPDWQAGYPNDRCNTGWTAFHAPFDGAKGTKGTLALTVGLDGGFQTVAKTEPAMGQLSGRRIEPPKARPRPKKAAKAKRKRRSQKRRRRRTRRRTKKRR